MKKVIILKGLPASGKSTWAKKLMADNPGVYKRVNKDDLRAMLDGSKWSKDNEKFVLDVRDSIIIAALNDGKHVIVDDTNLASKHEDRIRQLVGGIAQVEIKEFDESPEVCIKRDLLRPVSVGERVIMQMYDQFVAPSNAPLKQDATKPGAIIVDIDGTLAKMNGRSPYEWDKVDTDILNAPVAEAVCSLSENNHIIYLSGRDSVCRDKTLQWLTQVPIKKFDLYMRPEGDRRKDAIIKKELFDEHIRGKFYVRFVLDDRDQVVRLWRKEIGIPCFQVDYGNF